MELIRLSGPNFLAVDDERIFLTQTAAHFAERGPHFFLTGAVDEVYERRVFVRVSWRSVECRAVAGLGELVAAEDRRLPV